MKNVFLFFISLVILVGCKKKTDDPIVDNEICGRVTIPGGDSFIFKIVDQYGTELIGAWGDRYISDSIKILTIDRKILDYSRWEVGDNGLVKIKYLDDTPIPSQYNKLFNKQYLIRYPAISKETPADIDTIRLEYEFYEATRPSYPMGTRTCKYIAMKTYKVYYNQVLNYNGRPDSIFISLEKTI
jgi:hypothetical protein